MGFFCEHLNFKCFTLWLCIEANPVNTVLSRISRPLKQYRAGFCRASVTSSMLWVFCVIIILDTRCFFWMCYESQCSDDRHTNISDVYRSSQFIEKSPSCVRPRKRLYLPLRLFFERYAGVKESLKSRLKHEPDRSTYQNEPLYWVLNEIIWNFCKVSTISNSSRGFWVDCPASLYSHL
jgi:hypothetical protein